MLTFDELLQPILEVMADGQARSLADLRDAAAVHTKAGKEERDAMLPSGRQSVWDNRCGWAIAYLKRAGFLERPSRGVYVITTAGRQAQARQKGVDLAYLRTLPVIQEFEKPGGLNVPPVTNGEGTKTPDELVQEGFDRHQATLAADLLERLKGVHPGQFERIVVELLVAMGYGGTFEDAARVVGRAGDGGIDGVIKEDPLGLDAIYVQAKRWQGSVGSPTVAEFVGALAARYSSKGVLITTGTFTTAARDYVRHLAQRVILVDGPMLAELMIEHGIGVTPVRTLVLKRIDTDYFEGDV